MTITTLPPLTEADIDALVTHLTELDPRPSEPWEYFTSWDQTRRPLESVGHVRDLLAALPDDTFIIITKEGWPGLFTQAWRHGNRYGTECSIPNRWGNLIHHYRTADGEELNLTMAHLVMGSYIRRGWRLPEWAGPELITMQY